MRLPVIGVNSHKIYEGDFTVMLDSLNELFQECGVYVTPKDLATRMEQKLHRNIHYNFAAYLYTLLGFETRSGIGLEDRVSRYIVFNPELLAQKRGQFCQADIAVSNKNV
jgi:hypothetical protein